MSKRQMDVLVDDLDGTIIMEGEGRTVPISVDGRTVELDLTNDHIKELEESLAKFIGPVQPASNGYTPAPRNSSQDLSVVREWARKNGHNVSARGRIPFSVMDAFTKAHVGQLRR